MVRAGERNRLFFDYFTLDRTGSATITQPIVFRDSVLQVGDPVQSQLDLRVLSLTYGYSFWHSEKLEIAGDAGRRAPSRFRRRRRYRRRPAREPDGR